MKAQAMTRRFGIASLPERSAMIAIAAVVLLSLGACSDDKGPTDDGDGDMARLAKAEACSASSTEFSACARTVLAKSGLSSSERTALSSCDFLTASATESSEDLFEVARSAVSAHCY